MYPRFRARKWVGGSIWGSSAKSVTEQIDDTVRARSQQLRGLNGASFKKRMKSYEIAYQRKHTRALVDALILASEHKRPIPSWLRDGLLAQILPETLMSDRDQRDQGYWLYREALVSKGSSKSKVYEQIAESRDAPTADGVRKACQRFQNKIAVHYPDYDVPVEVQSRRPKRSRVEK